MATHNNGFIEVNPEGQAVAGGCECGWKISEGHGSLKEAEAELHAHHVDPVEPSGVHDSPS